MGKKKQQLARLAGAQAAAAEAGGGGKTKGKQKPMSKKERARLEELERAQAKQNRKKEAQTKQAIRKARERGKWRADDIECRKEMAAFAVQLYGLGLKVRAMAGDGNCLFRAIADQLLNNAGKHSTVREQICAYMDENKDNFLPFVEDDKPWERYLADMRKLATWGGNLEIQAASMFFKVNVSIHQLGAPTWQVINWPAAQRMINISFHDGDHYNSVHPLPPEELDPVARQKAIDRTNKMVAESANANADEEIIMQCTSCYDLELVRKLMARCRNDTDTVIDLICTVAPELGKEWQDDVIHALLPSASPAVVDVTPVEWNCSECTLTNTADRVECAACESPKPRSAETAPAATPAPLPEAARPAPAAASKAHPGQKPAPASKPPVVRESNRMRKERLAAERLAARRERQDAKVDAKKKQAAAPPPAPTLGSLAI